MHDRHVLLPQIVYAVVDLYGTSKAIKITSSAGSHPSPSYASSPSSPTTSKPAAPSSSLPPAKTLPVRFSRSCGRHIQFRMDQCLAQRIKSSANGIVVTSSPLPDHTLFQVHSITIEIQVERKSISLKLWDLRDWA